MAGALTVPVFARVFANMTGDVTLNGVTTVPRPRESAISLMTRAVMATAAQTGLEVELSALRVGINARLRVAASSVFALEASGTAATYTGFTSHSGAAEYDAPNQAIGVLTPDYGIKMGGAFTIQRGGVTADGAAAVTGPVGATTIEVVSTWSFFYAWTLETVLVLQPDEFYDVFYNGRFERITVGDFVRRPRSTKRTDGPIDLIIRGTTVAQ